VSRLPDASLDLLTHGYDYLRQHRHASADPRAAVTRLMGRRAVVIAGPDLAQAFCDGARFTRENALPGFVLDTLFGREAVHTLDGAAHAERKGMLVDVLHRDNPGELVQLVASAWDDAALRWQDSGARVSLHDASAHALFGAVCRWMGVPLEPGEIDEKARWMIAMVDGFAPVGWRHVRARRARRRAEVWIESLVVASRERGGRFSSRWHAIVDHKDAAGEVLSAHAAAVEILNILRPATAISWFIAYAGHALHRSPEQRTMLSDPTYATEFAHEVRRYYPFVPFLGALSLIDQRLDGIAIAKGDLVLLDVYGQLHDELWWDNPEAFRPTRFRDRLIDPFTLIPQGGGDVRTGHRCPGEDITVDVLRTIVPRLARMRYDVPEQDLRVPLRRIPSHVNSGFEIERVSIPDA
jgi:fatty-acid peroxygenase